MQGDDWQGGGRSETGVSGGSPADLFEKMDADERAIADAAPFRVMPTSPGRPRGAPNKRTLEMRDLYLRSGFPHPLLWQGHMLKLGIDGAAAMLCCDRLEAAEILRKIAADALPYLESKMPTKVDVKDERLPVLVIREHDTRASLAQGRSAGALAIDDDLADALIAPEQNQGLGADGAQGSHGQGSHDQSEALEPVGVARNQAAD